MALSRAQKLLLDKYNVSTEIQNWMSSEFNESGETLLPGSPDFLMVLSDHLQIAETYLESQRTRLNLAQNPKQDARTSAEEWQTLLTSYETTVKEAWDRASSYWRIIDQVISKPEDYGVRVNRKQIDYAFQKKNLPLVEMLKWSKPDYFRIPQIPLPKKIYAGFLAGIMGMYTGIRGGLHWARKYTSKEKPLLRRWALLFLYGFRAFFMGMMMGAITGARLGYQTGKIIASSKLGYYAALYNPFREPKGSKHKHGIDLKVQETLFHLFSKENEKRILAENLDQRFIIRFAKEDEVGIILNFIKELAAHEKILSEVKANETTLKASLFGEGQKAEAVLGFLDGEPVACMIFYHNYYSVLAKSGIFIEDLYVQEAHRGYGLGERLLSFLAGLAQKRDCERIEWLVSKRNMNASAFYQRMGARPLDHWTPYRIEGNAIRELAGYAG